MSETGGIPEHRFASIKERSLNPMSGVQDRKALLEKLAGAVMFASVEDDSSLETCEEALHALAEAEPSEVLRERVAELADGIRRIRESKLENPEEAFESFRSGIARLQELFAESGNPSKAESRTDPEELILPEYVEESVFLEFISDSSVVIEDLEADILSLEEGGAEGLQSIRRRIHTLKGEAGVLGLTEVERVCHALEDGLTEDFGDTDVLLEVKDWLSQAFQVYAERKRPLGETERIIARIVAAARGEDGNGINPTAAGGEAGVSMEDESRQETTKEEEFMESIPSEDNGCRERALEWDEETLEVVGEFLHEAEEGMTQVDEILLGAENSGVDKEEIDALFRVFHTIKGLAGFLELQEITDLAHTTETMLDHARKGRLAIEGKVLDLAFDASEMMRRMVHDLHRAVKEGTGLHPESGLNSLVERLTAVIEGKEPPSGEEPPSRRPSPAPETKEADSGEPRTGRELDRSKSKTSPPPVKEAGAGGGKLREVVKIDLERVDNLVSLIGELVIVEAMIANAPELAQASSRLVQQISQMSKITKDLQDIGTRMRMVPVRGVFQKMARMVRDLSRRSGKAITVKMSGEGTELDRGMVEAISDPLVHMIRNSVDHGIEDGETRKRTGKPLKGTIELRAFHEGGSVVIQIADDGRGLDKEAILAKALEKGIVGEGETLTDQEIYNLVFAPGFSTAKKVTEISGRGVGMDVVRRNIESIRGRVKIDSTPGKGSEITMILPLTLAIIDGMLITCGEDRYIIPTLSVVESLKPDPSMVFSVTGKGEIISLRGETIPLYRLHELLDIHGAITDPTSALVVIVESCGRKIGLMVDDVLKQQQVVIKGLGDNIPGTRYLSGAAIMSDGRVGLILNTDEIVNLVTQATFHRRGVEAESPDGDQEGGTKTPEEGAAGEPEMELST